MSLVSENASNALTLLKGTDSRLKVLGLKKLNALIDYHWHEISDSLAQIEALYEDEAFPEKKLAASVISKVYYHLEEYNDAVNYALESGEYFDLTQRSQYIDTLIGKCIDRYVSERQRNADSREGAEKVEINRKLEEIIEKIFQKSISEREYRLGLGVALDARRLDKVEEILKGDGYSSDLLGYLTKTALTFIKNKNIRSEVLKLIVQGYNKREKNFEDYANICQAHFLLNDHEAIAHILFDLIRSEDLEREVLAYQIAADLNDNENNHIISGVVKELNKVADTAERVAKARDNLTTILKGQFKDEAFLRFYKDNNQTDPAIILNLKQTLDIKNSIVHSGCLASNAIMNTNTTDDNFLRNNLDWVSKASHWAKFSATASLGTIHKTNRSKAMEILRPYFPGNAPTPSFYTHGGSLYALGLIHTGDRDQSVIDFILGIIKNPTYNANETLIHGACLGLGLVNLCAFGDEEGENLAVYEELKNVLFTDSATTGEAAALAIGLSMVGSANQLAIQDLLTYAHETQHEKIIRSIALALALIMCGKEENADALITQLCDDKDPILRYGGMYMIGLAFVGTSNNTALRKLLHFAVSDVSDDVRRAAVTNIGLLMLKDYQQVPKIVSLLAGSFNPHVRYGATLAVGISCAGSCNAEALTLLEPMVNDSVDFVRQGAYIATSMILQQSTAAFEPKVEKFRTQLNEIIAKKHEDPLVRLGVLLAVGILDAGGRNANISLLSQFGYPKLTACAGMVVFAHFWYWFPLVQFFSLTLSPSAFIGVDKNLRIPKGFQFKSNAKPSLFDYPAHIKPDDKKKEVKKKVVELSLYGKSKARAAKRAAGGKDAMEEEPKKEEKKEEKMEEEKVEEKPEEPKVEEPNFKVQNNFSRVLPRQEEHISYVEDNRYRPVVSNRKRGIVFLIDKKEGEAEQFHDAREGENKEPEKAAESKVEEHLAPPEAFEFDESTQLLGDKK